MSDKMNPEIKAKWLEALRSGHYQQGQSHLRTGDSYCCLGVLCDLIDPVEWQQDDEAYPEEVVLFRGHDELPPHYICEVAGIPTPETVHPQEPERNNITETLALMNDSGATFEHIADFIEEKL